MTQVLFYGCLFITFSPILAFFFMVIAKNSQLVILTIGGSFFWLVSILISAIWWYIIPPMREQWWFIISFSVLFQEIFRYIFYRLYSYGFNDRPSLNQIKETRHQMALDSMRKRKQQNGGSSSNEIESINNEINNNNNNNNNDDDENKEITEEEKEKIKIEKQKQREIEISARLETLSARPNHTLSSAAIGVGSGVAYGFIMFGSILWESTGPGTLFSPACPTVNLFMLSSIITLFMTLLHVVYNVLAFQGYRSKKYHLVAFVIITHFVTTYLTLLNLPTKTTSCFGSVFTVGVITLFSVGFCIFSLLKSDSITKIH
ncbi:hypothetical protein RB653_007620 [Dictyostelium firmibasis]|uniref:Gamma-secretase subunit Aph-1 n=1 Tax=Dictyostelium firmibasis TaxID=79012 RepID=A0AAN7TUV5_9MYCE